MAKVMLVGGGTGGHIYPNLALVPALERRGLEVVYGGEEGESAEARLAALNGIPFFGVPCVKFRRSVSLESLKNNASIPRKLSEGKRRAEEILRAEKPDIVFSKGGFAALPFVLAAARLGLPVVCHESDSTLGLSNRIARRKGARVLTAYPEVGFGEFVGMPVREELFCRDRETARRELCIEKGLPVLLAVGGSSGATAINEAVIAALPELTRFCAVIHVSGKGKNSDLPPRSARYVPLPYCDDIATLYAASDVVLSRAGATAVAEISALKKRAVFVPLPKGVSRGDQIPNARLAEKYGALVLVQNDKFRENLVPAIRRALETPPMRRIASDTGGKIAEIIDDTIRRGVKCKDKKPSPNGSPS